MRALERVKSRYETYLEEVKQIIASAKPGAGLFGIGTSPKDDPCNDRFFKDMQMIIADLEKENLSSEETEEVLSYIYSAQEGRKQDFVFFSMTAVHGMTMPLVLQLTPEAAGKLADMYEVSVRPVERLPVQQQLLKALYERAGRQPKRRGLFGRR